MGDDDDDDDVASILDGSFNTRLGNLDQEIGGVVLPGAEPNPVTKPQNQDYNDDDYEYYDDDYDYEYYDDNRSLGPVSPEPVPIRKSKWHPQVGLAPSPNVKDAGSKLDTRNRNYKPAPRKVEIFNDKDYLKRVKSPKFGRKSKSAVVERTRTPQSPEGELLSSKRQQRSREGSLYRVKTADVVSHTQYEAAFSKKGYEVKPKHKEDWEAKSSRLQKEHEQLQDDIKRLENDNRTGHYKYYNSNGTQTLDRMTSAEKKLAEVDRQRKLLEKEERNFLLVKERSHKKLELEERNFLLELKRVELARKRIEQLEKDELKMMENTQAIEKNADKKLRILENERNQVKDQKEHLEKEKILEEERLRLEEEKRKFELEKERKALEDEKKMFEEYKKQFQLGLAMERESMERERFENYTVPRNQYYDDDIKPLRIDPFDD